MKSFKLLSFLSIISILTFYLPAMEVADQKEEYGYSTTDIDEQIALALSIPEDEYLQETILPLIDFSSSEKAESIVSNEEDAGSSSKTLQNSSILNDIYNLLVLTIDEKDLSIKHEKIVAYVQKFETAKQKALLINTLLAQLFKLESFSIDWETNKLDLKSSELTFVAIVNLLLRLCTIGIIESSVDITLYKKICSDFLYAKLLLSSLSQKTPITLAQEHHQECSFALTLNESKEITFILHIPQYLKELDTTIKSQTLEYFLTIRKPAIIQNIDSLLREISKRLGKELKSKMLSDKSELLPSETPESSLLGQIFEEPDLLPCINSIAFLQKEIQRQNASISKEAPQFAQLFSGTEMSREKLEKIKEYYQTYSNKTPIGPRFLYGVINLILLKFSFQKGQIFKFLETYHKALQGNAVKKALKAVINLWIIRLIFAPAIRQDAIKPFKIGVDEALLFIKHLRSTGEIQETEWTRLYALLSVFQHFCTHIEDFKHIF